MTHYAPDAHPAPHLSVFAKPTKLCGHRPALINRTLVSHSVKPSNHSHACVVPEEHHGKTHRCRCGAQWQGIADQRTTERAVRPHTHELAGLDVLHELTTHAGLIAHLERMHGARVPHNSYFDSLATMHTLKHNATTVSPADVPTKINPDDEPPHDHMPQWWSEAELRKHLVHEHGIKTTLSATHKSMRKTHHQLHAPRKAKPIEPTESQIEALELLRELEAEQPEPTRTEPTRAYVHTHSTSGATSDRDHLHAHLEVAHGIPARLLSTQDELTDLHAELHDGPSPLVAAAIRHAEAAHPKRVAHTHAGAPMSATMTRQHMRAYHAVALVPDLTEATVALAHDSDHMRPDMTRPRPSLMMPKPNRQPLTTVTIPARPAPYMAAHAPSPADLVLTPASYPGPGHLHRCQYSTEHAAQIHRCTCGLRWSPPSPYDGGTWRQTYAQYATRVRVLESNRQEFKAEATDPSRTLYAGKTEPTQTFTPVTKHIDHGPHWNLSAPPQSPSTPSPTPEALHCKDCVRGATQPVETYHRPEQCLWRPAPPTA